MNDLIEKKTCPVACDWAPASRGGGSEISEGGGSEEGRGGS